MKTENYNPSTFETELAKAIEACREDIQKKLSGFKIVDFKGDFNRDNPHIDLHVEDKDGDRHELVIKIIQRPDAF